MASSDSTKPGSVSGPCERCKPLASADTTKRAEILGGNTERIYVCPNCGQNWLMYNYLNRLWGPLTAEEVFAFRSKEAPFSVNLCPTPISDGWKPEPFVILDACRAAFEGGNKVEVLLDAKFPMYPGHLIHCNFGDGYAQIIVEGKKSQDGKTKKYTIRRYPPPTQPQPPRVRT